jgi:hypothetical protein
VLAFTNTCSGELKFIERNSRPGTVTMFSTEAERNEGHPGRRAARY